MKGILGKKLGMSQVFLNNGQLVPVTIIEVQPNVVSQVKTDVKDKYNSLQLAAFDLRVTLSNQPEIGHFKKADSQPKRFVKEIRNMIGFNHKDLISVADIFAAGEFVDVQGTSKGKGFSGRIKRHNQSRGPMGHGSGLHRQMGSTGSINANRVFKSQPMPGQMGNVTRSVANLEVIKVDRENNYILVKGSVPGPKLGFLVIKQAVKKSVPKTPVELVVRNQASTAIPNDGQ